MKAPGTATRTTLRPLKSSVVFATGPSGVMMRKVAWGECLQLNLVVSLQNCGESGPSLAWLPAAVEASLQAGVEAHFRLGGL